MTADEKYLFSRVQYYRAQAHALDYKKQVLLDKANMLEEKLITLEQKNLAEKKNPFTVDESDYIHERKPPKGNVPPRDTGRLAP